MRGEAPATGITVRPGILQRTINVPARGTFTTPLKRTIESPGRGIEIVSGANTGAEGTAGTSRITIRLTSRAFRDQATPIETFYEDLVDGQLIVGDFEEFEVTWNADPWDVPLVVRIFEKIPVVPVHTEVPRFAGLCQVIDLFQGTVAYDGSPGPGDATNGKVIWDSTGSNPPNEPLDVVDIGRQRVACPRYLHGVLVCNADFHVTCTIGDEDLSTSYRFAKWQSVIRDFQETSFSDQWIVRFQWAAVTGVGAGGDEKTGSAPHLFLPTTRFKLTVVAETLVSDVNISGHVLLASTP